MYIMRKSHLLSTGWFLVDMTLWLLLFEAMTALYFGTSLILCHILWMIFLIIQYVASYPAQYRLV